MKERPILFSAPMVRALLAGTKTQTRRVVKLKPWHQIEERDDGAPWPWMYDGERDADHWLPCPYGQPGDRLWVREGFSGPRCMEAQDGCAATPPSKWGESSRIWYWADGDPPTYGDWTRPRPRPSIHMPRWASRITLEVTGVRVERLQDISEADAVAEGVKNSLHLPGGRFATENFAHLWWSINGDGSWEANPWVWVVEFKRIEGEKT